MNDLTDQRDDGLFPIGQIEPLGSYVRQLWRRRDFIVQVPLNELRVQHANTLLGNLWLVLNPLLQVTVYFIVFGLIIRTDRGVDDFLVFLTIGVFTFYFSQRIITNGARSIQTNIGLIRSMRFPRAVLPIGSTVAGVLSFGPILLIMLAITLSHGNWPNARWTMLVPLFIGQVLFSAGGSFFVARMNHVYSDLENTLPFLFRLVFYMSGVLYSVDRFIDGPTVRTLFAFNPMYCFLSIWRWVLMGLDVSTSVWIGFLGWSIITPVVGFFFFRAGESSYGRAN